MSSSVSPRAAGPTLLVFTLGPRVDAERRRLLGDRRRRIERDLFAGCLDRALAAGRAAGLALRVSSPRPLAETRSSGALSTRQRGVEFAARFRHAVADAFAAGAAPLVVIGSDTPDLETHHVRAALAVLDRDPDAVVVGPSRDGGFYLLAATRPVDGALARVRFRGSETRRLLAAALAGEGRRVVELEPLADLDRRPDLERWLAAARRRTSIVSSRAWREVVARLLGWLAGLVPEPLDRPASPRFAPAPVRSGRAPPSP